MQRDFYKEIIPAPRLQALAVLALWDVGSPALVIPWFCYCLMKAVEWLQFRIYSSQWT